MNVTGKIVETERMPSSRNGNPRFRVRLDNGSSFPTSPDAMIAYGIENREYRETEHTFVLNGRGHITHTIKNGATS